MTEEQIAEYGEPLYEFGKWIVTKKGIWRKDARPFKLFVDNSTLNNARPDAGGNAAQGHGYKYNKMLDVAEKDWVTDVDLQDFNYAYAYALGYFKINPSLDFHATLTAQLDLRDGDDSLDELWSTDEDDNTAASL